MKMNSALSKFKTYASLILAISVFSEMVLFFSVENLFAISALVGGWVVISTVLSQRNLLQYPVSFIMILGMAVLQYLLPLPLTLLELKPVTYNLRVPFLTFSHHFLFAVAIVITHKLYTIVVGRNNIFRALLKKTTFYQEPTNRIIWITSLLGLLAGFYSYFVMGIWHIERVDRDPLYYVMSSFSGFIWMPLIILFPKFRYYQPKNTDKTIKYVAMYSVFVILVAIVSNWRTTLFSGVFIIIGLFFLGLLLQQYKLWSIITPKKLVLLLVTFIVFSGPFLDLAQAMVIVRGDRVNLSPVEFFSRTIDVYNDKDKLETVRRSALRGANNNQFESGYWNENYLNNIVLNRMVNLKISDNCLYYADKIGSENSQMQSELANQIIALMSNVILGIFGISPEEKIRISNHSIGDALYGLAIHSESRFGSAIISSMPGVGMSIFGYWYLIMIIPLFALIFAMFDSLVNFKKGNIVFSYFFFLMFTIILNYFNDRHVFVSEFKFIFRDYFESVVIFLITMKTVRFISFDRNSKIRSADGVTRLFNSRIKKYI